MKRDDTSKSRSIEKLPITATDRESGKRVDATISSRRVIPLLLLPLLFLGGTAWFYYELQAEMRLVDTRVSMALPLQVIPLIVLFSGVIASTTVVALVLALVKTRESAAASLRLSAIVESSDDAIIGKTLEGIITSWNPGAQKMFGFDAQEAIGQSMSIVIPPERQDEEAQILERIAKGEHIKHFETERITKDGGRIAISATVSPIVDAKGRILGVSKIARDIGERKKFIAALESSNLELQRFAYVASHDLQTPLRSIVSFAELLQKSLAGTIDEEAADWLHRVVTSGEQMQTLIQDLLAYARIDSPQHVSQPVDLNKTFDAAKEFLFAAIQESGAEVSRGQLPTVMGDPSQLLQLLQNLMGNALKYRSTTRDLKPKVEVSSESLDGKHVIFVADNGIGIDPKQHDKIFELFQRLHSSRIYPGTGFGLAVCRRIVERLGGRIWVQSEPGCGSRFCFSLPASSNHS
jgi:PAS domain S-box-containing protein